MATLKIGEGITLEAKLPEVPEMQVGKFELLPETVAEKQPDPRLDTVSDRTYQNKKAIEKLQQDLGVLEEKVDDNHEDLIELTGMVNQLDMKEPMEMIHQPEIKQVTFHRDHTKDFEDVYQKMFLDKKELESKLRTKPTLEVFNRELKNQKRFNLILGALLLASLVLHLI